MLLFQSVPYWHFHNWSFDIGSPIMFIITSLVALAIIIAVLTAIPTDNNFDRRNAKESGNQTERGDEIE